jgi:hypothetical protein
LFVLVREHDSACDRTPSEADRTNTINSLPIWRQNKFTVGNADSAIVARCNL